VNVSSGVQRTGTAFGVQFYTKCAVPVLICAFLTAVELLAALPQTSWLDFGKGAKGKREVKESGKGK